MREPFVPESFVAPDNIDLGDYTMHLIKTENAVEDWVVIRENAKVVVQVRGGSLEGWPGNFGLEENYKDMAWLETCAKYNQLFCYIMRDKTTAEYLACVYVYPIEIFFADKATDFDVDFSFWVTQGLYDQGKYPEVFQSLLDWVKRDFPFDPKRIYLRNREIPDTVKSDGLES